MELEIKPHQQLQPQAAAAARFSLCEQSFVHMSSWTGLQNNLILININKINESDSLLKFSKVDNFLKQFWLLFLTYQLNIIYKKNSKFFITKKNLEYKKSLVML